MFQSATTLLNKRGGTLPQQSADQRATKLMAQEIQALIKYHLQYYTSCVYHVPSSYHGIPTFNRDAVIARITNELTNAGYHCEFLDQRHMELRISWQIHQESPERIHVELPPTVITSTTTTTPHIPVHRKITVGDGDRDRSNVTVQKEKQKQKQARKVDEDEDEDEVMIEVPTIEDVMQRYTKPVRGRVKGRGRGRTTTRGRGR